MDRLFLDTNVVLDLLGERKPFYMAAARITSMADKSVVQIVVSALSYSTIHYLLSRYEPDEAVRNKLRKLKIIASTADLTDTIIEKGLNSAFPDFEDALQYHCAISMNSTLILTRNEKDFKKSEIPVMRPDEYLRVFPNSR